MNTTFSRFKAAALASGLAAALAGCGGGGGGALPPPPPADGRYLFYTSPVTAVHPGDLSIQVADPGTADPESVQVILEGDDAGGGIVGNLRPWALIYARDGRIWRVDARRSGDQTPVQVSSVTFADNVCKSRLLPDPLAPEKSVYAFWLPGNDNNCATQDDNLAFLMPVTTAPDQFPAGGAPVEWLWPIYDHSGPSPTLKGALYRLGSALGYMSFYTPNSSIVLDGVIDAQPLALTTDGGVLLRVKTAAENAVRKFDPALDDLNGFKFQILGPSITISQAVANETEVFYAIDETVYRAPLDNLAAAQGVYGVVGATPQIIRASAGRVAVQYKMADNSTRLVTFNTTDYTPETWADIPPGEMVALMAVSDDRIFYNVGTDLANGKAVTFDGSLGNNFLNSLWTGVVNGQAAPLNLVADLSTLAGEVTHVLYTTQVGGVTVRTSDNQFASNHALPAGIDRFHSQGLALEGTMLGVSALTGDRHVLALRLDQDGPVEQVTDMPGQINVAGGCTVGNGTFDPLLPLLLALAAAGVARRWRQA